jgi:hypothetical protein
MALYIIIIKKKGYRECKIKLILSGKHNVTTFNCYSKIDNMRPSWLGGGEMV